MGNFLIFQRLIVSVAVIEKTVLVANDDALIFDKSVLAVAV